MRYRINHNRAFTLIETLVGVAVFLIISVAAYQAYTSLFILISLNQYKAMALNLANEQFELARNMSYLDLEEIPEAQNLVRSGISFDVATVVVPSGNKKVVEVQVDCQTCKSFTPLAITTIFYE